MHRRHSNEKTAEPLTPEQQDLVNDNIGLAGFFVKRYPPKHLDSDDAYAESLLVLCRAAKHFRPELQIKFSTFAASCWVHFLMTIRDKVRAKRNGYWETLEIEEMSIRDDETSAVASFASDTEQADKIASAREDVAMMLKLIHGLDERSGQVVMRRIGGENMAEIGKSLGVSRERVRQIFDTAVACLRRRWARRESA